MSTPTTMQVAELSKTQRRFLFACAFWMASSDSVVNGEEIAWLVSEFGEQTAEAWTGEFCTFSDEEFFQDLDGSLEAMSIKELQDVIPQLKKWLLSLAYADSVFAIREKITIRQILQYLDMSPSPSIQVKGRKPALVRKTRESQPRRLTIPTKRNLAQNRLRRVLDYQDVPGVFTLIFTSILGVVASALLWAGTHEGIGWNAFSLFSGLVLAAVCISSYVTQYCLRLGPVIQRCWLVVGVYSTTYLFCLFGHLLPGVDMEHTNATWLWLMLGIAVLHASVKWAFKRAREEVGAEDDWEAKETTVIKRPEEEGKMRRWRRSYGTPSETTPPSNGGYYGSAG